MTIDSTEWDDWCGLSDLIWISKDSLRSVAEREQQYGITAWDSAIFHALWYLGAFCRSEESLVHMAFDTHGRKWPEKATAAVRRSFDRGWIQTIDSEFNTRMTLELTTQGYLMPNGLLGLRKPMNLGTGVGLISFTTSGAELCQRAWEVDTNRDWTVDGIVGTNDCFAYGVTLEDCDDAILASNDRCMEMDLHRYSTEKIGRWCNRWWMRYESGYRVRFALPPDPDPPDSYDGYFQ